MAEMQSERHTAGSSGFPSGGAISVAARPREIPSDADVDHPHLFFNRELSWIDFNWRVLSQALDERNPLLERLRFLVITSTNLDEFFRKRVGGLKRQLAAGVQSLSPDGRRPEEQLALISEAVRALYPEMCRAWCDVLQPLLSEQIHIDILPYHALERDQKAFSDTYFQTSIFPILTPLAVDPGHPFPFISNLSLSLAIMLRHPRRGTRHFARLKVPSGARRWLELPDNAGYVPLEEVIAANVHQLFRGMEVESVHAFRISRNADLLRDEEEADDLVEMISEELRERRFAPVVRMEVEATMPMEVRQLLMKELALGDDDVYESEALLDFSDLVFFADMNLPEARFEPFHAVTPVRLLYEGETNESESVFDVIRSGDVLVHHPYESFLATVQRFIEEAAEDPRVVAIKQTLYRTSAESPIVKALVRAAEQGKHVAVLVEVKARFDEASNMEWGQMLEQSGVHVTYGLVGLKTHCKTTLVIREETDGPRAYCHIGTGNYNPATARIYSDLGLFTSVTDITADVVNLFHYLTGYAPEQHYNTLLVAPRDLRRRFQELIAREVDNQTQHGNGRIIAMINALDDVDIMHDLYRASQAGVEIDLFVRGHCRLRPGVPGYSDNIRVRSIVGRFLEHSRVYYFENGGNPDIYIGSADWQRRNLDDRVEAVVPIFDLALRRRITSILQLTLRDRRTAWELHPDGRYEPYLPNDDQEERSGFQETLMERYRLRSMSDEAPWDLN